MAYLIYKLIQTIRTIDDIYNVANQYGLLHCFVAKMAVEFGQLKPDQVPWHELWKLDQEQLNG